MKCIKNQYISPLGGSVYCEAIAKDDLNSIDFGADCALKLYNRHNEFEEFLSKNVEDLVKHVPEELKDIIVKAEFGHTAMQNDKLFLLTEIYTVDYINQEQDIAIRQWILGQLSDGWGESLEQNCVMSEQVANPTVEFDTYNGEFVNDEGYDIAEYFLSPSENIKTLGDIEVLDREEVEIETQKELAVRTIDLITLQQEIQELYNKIDELTRKLESL